MQEMICRLTRLQRNAIVQIVNEMLAIMLQWAMYSARIS